MPRLAGTILALTLAGAAVGACRRGGAPANAGAAAAVPPPADAGSEPQLADLSGAYANALTLTQRTGDGQIASGGAFAVELDRPGTLVLSGDRFEAASCSGAFGDQRFVLRELNPAGTTVKITPLALYVPLAFAAPQRLVLEVYASAAATCAAAGPVTLRFALRFFPAGQLASASASPPAPPPDAVPPSAVFPGLPQTPSPPTPPPATPVPVTPPTPPPATPVPVTPPVTPPPICPSLAGQPDATLPQALRATIVVNAKLSEREGCHEVAQWRVADVVSRPVGAGCPPPQVAVALASQSSDNRLVKISETSADFGIQLAWILAPDAATAAQLVAELQAGRTVALTPAADGCGATGTPAVPLASPDDWLIFRGDPRDACDVAGAAAPGPAVTLTESLDAAGHAAGLDVAYRYGSASDFDWTMTFGFAATSAVASALSAGGGQPWEANIYSRRAHAYTGAWTPLVRGTIAQGTITVAEPTELVRLLPYQADSEVVFRPPPAVSGCGQRLVYPYDQAFQDAARGAAFKDLTNPGRSRFLLQETDLPH